MVCIEFTLNLNHMQNVLSFPGASPGQLIPLLIGITSLLCVSYIILRNRRPWTHIHRLGLTMNHTKNTYSPPSKNSPPEAEETANLPLNNSTIDPSPPPGHLLHRILFTWLPWLNLFNSSPRHSFTLLHSRASSGGGGVTMHDSNVSYDDMRSRRSPKPTTGEMENADVPLIQFTPPQIAGTEWPPGR
jgi:hypothetical protein